MKVMFTLVLKILSHVSVKVLVIVREGMGLMQVQFMTVGGVDF